MEFSIDVHTGLNGKIIIEDYSREYDQYFSEDETNQEKGKYKYSESKTINVLTKVNSDSEHKIGDPIIHNHDQLKPDPLYPDNYIYDLEKIKFTIDDDGYYLMHHIVLPTKQWLENTYLTHENEDYRKSYESIYIIDDNDIFKVSIQQLSINKENRLRKITKLNNSNTVTIEYIYDENLNVVEIKTSDEIYAPLIAPTYLSYDENGLLIKSEKYNAVDINDYNALQAITEYTYTDGKLTSYTVKEFNNYILPQEPHEITVYTLTYEGNNVVEVNSTREYYGYDFDSDSYKFVTGAPTKIIYSYENDKLIKEESSYYEQWAEPPGFLTNCTIVYEYNEAGNCISATKTDEYKNVTVTEYIYDETNLESNVYSFAFPHEIKPVNTNIIFASIKRPKDSVVEDELIERSIYEYIIATNSKSNSKSNYNLKNNKLSYDLEPVSIEEIYKRNTEGTTIEKCTIDIFYTGYLQHCYINYCNKLFSKLTKNCNDLCIREDHKELIYIRDFLWMVLNIIDYQISFKNYMEAQRLLEITNYCGNFCQNKESYVGSNTGCRCS